MTLHVFQSECDWVVAESVDDAYKVYQEHTGMSRAEVDEYICDGDDYYFEQLSDEHELPIIDDMEVPQNERVRTVKTCAEWVKSDGRGFLCSTEY